MPTAVQQYQQQAATLQQRVCNVVQISTDEFCNRQYIQGLSYLQWYLPNHPNCRKILEANAAYWGWWKLMWNARDEVYLENVEHFDLDLSIKQLLWYELHAAWNVIGDTKPPKQVAQIILSKKNETIYDTCNKN